MLLRFTHLFLVIPHTHTITLIHMHTPKKYKCHQTPTIPSSLQTFTPAVEQLKTLNFPIAKCTDGRAGGRGVDVHFQQYKKMQLKYLLKFRHSTNIYESKKRRIRRRWKKRCDMKRNTWRKKTQIQISNKKRGRNQTNTYANGDNRPHTHSHQDMRKKCIFTNYKITIFSGLGSLRKIQFWQL